jgi:hypothetical protein
MDSTFSRGVISPHYDKRKRPMGVSQYLINALQPTEEELSGEEAHWVP